MRVQPPRRWGRREFMKVVAALGQAAGLGAYHLRSAPAEPSLQTKQDPESTYPSDLCRAPKSSGKRRCTLRASRK